MIWKTLTERTPHKKFRCGSVNNLIAKCTKPPKNNKKRPNKVSFNKRGNRALQKECEKSDDEKDQKIYTSMV